MDFFYTLLISFSIVFFSELGDKTQLLVLSFSTKDKAKNILIGVTLGTFFSHGMAILFGSKLGSLENDTFRFCLQIFTYCSFLLFGILGFLPKKEDSNTSLKSSFFNKFSCIKLNYVFMVALAIFVGEFGDKTFLASLGLGLQYPNYKLSLIFGSILGMVLSNSLALFFGKFLGSRFNPKVIELLSNLIFIVFGLVGFINMIF